MTACSRSSSFDVVALGAWLNGVCSSAPAVCIAAGHAHHLSRVRQEGYFEKGTCLHVLKEPAPSAMKLVFAFGLVLHDGRLGCLPSLMGILAVNRRSSRNFDGNSTEAAVLTTLSLMRELSPLFEFPERDTPTK